MAKTYTEAEVQAALLDLTVRKIATFEQEILKLRKREELRANLHKAIIPPHRHNTGQSVGAAVEDIPAAKLAQKAEMCKTCGSEVCKCMSKTSALENKVQEGADENPKSKVDTSADKVKAPGSGGQIKRGPKALAKSAMAKMDSAPMPAMAQTAGAAAEGMPGTPMQKSKPLDEKHWKPKPAAPGESEEETAHRELLNTILGPGGGSKDHKARIKAGYEKLAGLRAKKEAKKAEPPMAKPPSGVNMSTKVPASKPMAPPKMPGAPAMKGELEKGDKNPNPGEACRLCGGEGKIQKIRGKTKYLATCTRCHGNTEEQGPSTAIKPNQHTDVSGHKVKRYDAEGKELEKGVMADIARRNSPPSPSNPATPPQAKTPMPSPEQHAQRAAVHQQALQGAFEPKAPVVSGLELQPKKPGIFGRIGSK